jgi:hypothetical protein
MVEEEIDDSLSFQEGHPVLKRQIGNLLLSCLSVPEALQFMAKAILIAQALG